ncbi:hypothetical protein Moror_9483 [Moniliophthora roreri MCA 2997]|uniref:F-box domain-containing protein n=1 Tax=Moniliophthora roreri (strain MCA 2997) TaxID=1381753 RepID=V2WGF9_MONRO|nr:hypothetical protein Moror_9483 [Moniliophthora roreri MCA 2997]
MKPRLVYQIISIKQHLRSLGRALNRKVKHDQAAGNDGSIQILGLRIPPELIELIIHQLKGDNPSLGSCSLLSRAWASHARSELFRQVVLDDWASLEQFMRLCSDQHSTIPAAGIRILILVPQQELLSRIFHWLSTPTNNTASQNIAVCLFWRLEHLELLHPVYTPGIAANSMVTSQISHSAKCSQVGYSLTVTRANLDGAPSEIRGIISLIPPLQKRTLGFGKASIRVSHNIPCTSKSLEIRPAWGLTDPFPTLPLPRLRISTIREFSVHLTKEISSEVEYLLTRGDAATMGAIKRCKLGLPQQVTSTDFISLVKALVTRRRIPKIVIEGTVPAMDGFLEWVYTSDSRSGPCHSQVTEISLQRVHLAIRLEETVPRLLRMDTSWATHPWFRSLAEVKVDVVVAVDGMTPGVPPNTREEAIEMGKETLCEALPICSRKELLKSTFDVEYYD